MPRRVALKNACGAPFITPSARFSFSTLLLAFRPDLKSVLLCSRRTSDRYAERKKTTRRLYRTKMHDGREPCGIQIHGGPGALPEATWSFREPSPPILPPPAEVGSGGTRGDRSFGEVTKKRNRSLAFEHGVHGYVRAASRAGNFCSTVKSLCWLEKSTHTV